MTQSWVAPLTLTVDSPSSRGDTLFVRTSVFLMKKNSATKEEDEQSDDADGYRPSRSIAPGNRISPGRTSTRPGSRATANAMRDWSTSPGSAS
jgi:hypothetical protein